MPDIAGDTSTTATLTIGGSATDALEVTGDHDWFRIELVAGQKIVINVDGLTLDDSLVSIRNSVGTLLAENDDINLGSIRDSRLVFTAPATGTYYIDVGAYADQGSGSYKVSVDLYTPPPAASIETIAAQLSSGYWGGDSHKFNVSQGGTITVNLTGLTAAGQALANEALALWSDTIGVTFTAVTTGGQITFDDNGEGAFSDGNWSNGIISSAFVNVSTQWLTTYGTTIGSYSFMTYIHEIGHALGLGHGGYYNSTATFPDDALFANDAWPVTVMSYFDQRDSSFFANQGFTFAYVTTPMIADIRAIGTLYGLSTNTRTSDTTYGFGNTSGRSVYTASVGSPATAYTIIDNGGTDTLNYSGFSSSQVINLNPETFSNIGGATGNVSIAFNTVIENAIGGSGNDTIIGNAANNFLTGSGGVDTLNGGGGNDSLNGGIGADMLTGGIGADIFIGAASELSGDTITDLTAGDRIVITNATLGSFVFSVSGSTLTFTGGALTLTGGIVGTLAASSAAGGGVQLAFQASAAIADVRNDFNGDGRSDILWRNVDGQMSNWLGQANGGFVANNANAAAVVPTAWKIVGTGDFNGDGRDDILWRHTDGTLSNWLGTAAGGYTPNDANAAVVVPTAWSVVGTGDFNGDGRDDVLWRNSDGTLTDWLGNANGGFTPNDANAARFVPTDWKVVGTGDFNGDGRDDILWRKNDGTLTDWLGNANGGFTPNDANAARFVPTAWSVVGTGDFNGDGRDDILWRNTDGTLSNWLGQANGGFIANDANAAVFVPTSWSVVATGDYNGDGRDDILWRNTDGTLSDWLGNANGGFTPNDANAATPVPITWTVQPEPFLL